MSREKRKTWKTPFLHCQGSCFSAAQNMYTRSSSASIEMPQHCLPATLLRRMELRSRWRFTMAVLWFRCRVNISIYCCSLSKKRRKKHLTNTKQTLHTKSLRWGWGNTNKQIFSQSEEKEEMEKLGKLVELRATLLCRSHLQPERRRGASEVNHVFLM